MPENDGIAPGYEQKNFTDDDKRAKLRLIASPDGREGSVTIHQDTQIFASVLKAGEAVSYALPEQRLGWIQVARGSVTLNGQTLKAGDGAQVEDVAKLDIAGAADDSEVLLFDLPH
jgi:redox-sensitive bicupin YhaK (pirin superfamily)